MNLFPSFVVDKRRFYSKNSTHLFVVLPNKGTRVRVNSNYIQLLLIGLCLGVTLGIAFIPLFDSFDCNLPFEGQPDSDSLIVLEPFNKLNKNTHKIPETLPKTLNEQSQSIKMRRPRFFSTELGLRKKLIAGIVLTDYDNLDNLVGINQTLSPFVSQTLFFVVGQSLAKEVKGLGFTNVVTLPNKLKSVNIQITPSGLNGSLRLDKAMYNRAALKAMKYLGGKVVDSYDYFFLGLDVFYINGRNLMNAVKQISISQDFLWGVVQGTACSLEKGLVISRSVMKTLSSRIDRCFHSSVLSVSNSLTKCFQYALSSVQCSNSIQDQKYLSISVDAVDEFYKAISIGPVSSPRAFYQIHTKITHTRSVEIGQDIREMGSIIDEMIPNIPKGFDISHWPKGLSMPHKPLTRFDVLRWKFFTLNNIYPKNEHITENHPNGIDGLDISSVVNVSLQYLHKTLYEDSSIAFKYGYQRFDETRGMEYLLDFTDANGQIYRVQGLRPLSKIEVVQVPFVTENRRLTIVVPVTLDQYNQTDAFLKSYFDISVDRKANSVLILAIIVDDYTKTEYKTSQLQSLKQLVTAYNFNQSKKVNNGSGTTASSDSLKVGYVVVNMRQSKTANFAIKLFDTLSGHVLSPTAQVLVIDSFVVLRDEFLNRVRMNTILNYQVFSPIPFAEYNPQMSNYNYDENDKLGIHKTSGYFDSQNFGFVSFFVGDFISATKQLELSVLMEAAKNHKGVSILSNLLLQGSQLHVLRAPEPYLKIKFPKLTLADCSSNEDCFKTKWSSKAELAKIISQ